MRTKTQQPNEEKQQRDFCAPECLLVVANRTAFGDDREVDLSESQRAYLQNLIRLCGVPEARLIAEGALVVPIVLNTAGDFMCVRMALGTATHEIQALLHDSRRFVLGHFPTFWEIPDCDLYEFVKMHGGVLFARRRPALHKRVQKFLLPWVRCSREQMSENN